ncbi:MAG: response regulator [Pseudomonadota bacterium]
MEPQPSAETPESSLNILVAEDNPVNQRLLCKYLERFGHRVTLANNGVEAVEMSQAMQPDLVLMDVQMPEMDGHMATRVIREREQGGGRRLTIVALTAHASKTDEQNCFDAGMDAYLSKPIQFDKLHEILANCCRG